MKPLISKSEATNKWYVVTAYKELGEGKIKSTKKYDVTEQMNEILKDIKTDKTKILKHLQYLDNVMKSNAPHHLAVLSNREFEDYVEKNPHLSSEERDLNKMVN